MYHHQLIAWGPEHARRINTFLLHRHQAYCGLSEARFRQSLSAGLNQHQSSSSPTTHQHPTSSVRTSPGPFPLQKPHACLLNAVYLLGCFFSASDSSLSASSGAAAVSPTQASPSSRDYSSYEPLFLYRARQGIARALENAERLDQAVQAASLVSVYLYAKGRVLEGYYLSCANARFAVGCGMHQMRSVTWNSSGSSAVGGRGGGEDVDMEEYEQDSSTMPLLESPRDPVELGERIHIWWQVRALVSSLFHYGDLMFFCSCALRYGLWTNAGRYLRIYRRL